MTNYCNMWIDILNKISSSLNGPILIERKMRTRVISSFSNTYESIIEIYDTHNKKEPFIIHSKYTQEEDSYDSVYMDIIELLINKIKDGNRS